MDASRRDFLKRATIGPALAGFFSSLPSGLQANPLGWPIGAQIYPHRPWKDFPAFLKMMAGIGVTRLELCSPIGYGPEFEALANPKEAKKMLADYGMKAESCHFTLREMREKQDQSIAWAKEVGIKYVIVASLGDGNGGGNPTLDQVKRASDEYNKIAAKTAKAGMQQGLHNEGFELSRIDGRLTYSRLFEMLDPKLVKYQFQMSTVTSGLVGAEYFAKYPGRFISMHVQDIDLNPVPPVPPSGQGQPGGRGRYRQVAAGKGSIDWVKTFQAAKKGGLKNYFVEQNWELTQQSVAYLRSLRV